MLHRFIRSAVVVALVAVFVPVVALTAGSVGSRASRGANGSGQNAGAGAYGTQVRLGRVTFDPTVESARVPDGLEGVARSDGAEGDLWLVQLRVPVTRDAQLQLAQLDLRPLAVVPDMTYVMRGDAATAEQARHQPGVRSVTAFPEWAKLGRDVESAASGTDLEIAVFPDATAVDVADRLLASGLTVAPVVGSSRVLAIRVSGMTQLAAAASDPGVAAIGRRAQLRTLNKIARWVTQSAQPGITPLSDHGLLGDGEVVGVADTGNDYFPDLNGRANDFFSDCVDPQNPSTATCKLADFTYQAPDDNPNSSGCTGDGNVTDGVYTANATNHRKVLAYFNLVAQCTARPGDSGSTTHGSHVSGSIAGDSPPFGSINDNDGMAPRAKIVMQDVGDDNEFLPGLPADYYELLSQAYEPGRVPSNTRGSSGTATPDDTVGPYVRGAGARVHNASLGSAVPVLGLGEASRVDDFVTNNEDMTVVVAAGNSGPDMATIGEPGIAKDAITSGAMATGFDDFMALGAVANFSSHGAAADFGLVPNLSRIKPDVVDPGLRVVSAKGGTNTETQVLQGTSMSAPVLSGNAALVRQYFEDGFGPAGTTGAIEGFAPGARNTDRGFNPSAALVKAVIVNSGQRMRGLYTGSQGSNASFNGQWPSAGQGWGRVELDRALHFDDLGGSPDLWVVDQMFCPPPAHCSGVTGNGVSTGDDKTYTIQVGAGTPLKVILSWSDPGGLGSFLGLGPEEVLTNQLALQVDGPDGTSYCGNKINTMSDPAADVATSMPGACNPVTDDKFNNVQGVYLPNPTPGTYTVHVVGNAVLQDQNAIGLQVPPLVVGRQGYAIAATGRFTDVPAVVPPTPPATAVTSADVTAPSNDLAVVHITTNVATTASVTLTPDTGSPITIDDVYSRPASSFVGLDLTQVENDGEFLNALAPGVEHLVKFTGLSPGMHYHVTYSLITVPPGIAPPPSTSTQFVGVPLTGDLDITLPTTVFAPTVASDTATIFSASTTAGPPIPDLNNPTWGASSQLYIGTISATSDLACRVAEIDACPPVDTGSGFKVRLPNGLQVGNITGAAVLLTTRHDLTSRVLGTPTHQLALLADSAEGKWGPGTTYQDVYGAPVQTRLGAPADYRSVPYSTEAFTVPCSALTSFVSNLQNGAAAFRLENGGDPGTTLTGTKLGESLYAYESGFGRRSSGIEDRPRIVLFTDATDPLGQPAASAPAISDVRVERADGDSIVVHWITDVPSDSLVFLRLGGAPLVQVGSPAFVTEHHVTVTGVPAGSGADFALRSTTTSGQSTTDTNGGQGWAVTDTATAPPGPALAASGSGSFPTPPATRVPASADDIAHGTGSACTAQTLSVTLPQPQPQPGTGTMPEQRSILPVTGTNGSLDVPFLFALLALLLAIVRRRTARHSVVTVQNTQKCEFPTAKTRGN